MARRFANRFHAAIMAVGTTLLLSTVVVQPAAAQDSKPAAAQNNKTNTTAGVQIYSNPEYGYTYQGCFTSDPDDPALDQGVTVVVPGRVTPKACLDVCYVSGVFLDMESNNAHLTKEQQELLDKLQQLADSTNSSGSADLQAAAAAFNRHEPFPPITAGNAYDHDGNGRYQYAGLGYDETLGHPVCICSEGLAATSENVTASECNTPCEGNSTWSCGGPGLVLLYNLTQPGVGTNGEHPRIPDTSGGAALAVSTGALIGVFLLAFGSL